MVLGDILKIGESPLDAIKREFQEEAGLFIENWTLCVIMTNKNWIVYLFYAYDPILNCKTQTDEKIQISLINSLPSNAIPNLKWLIPLCRDKDIKKPVMIIDCGEKP